MTLWYGLLPCLFLAPVAANDGLMVRPCASRLVADAVAAEATWQDFPGFAADLEIECAGKVSQGRLVVEPDGRVFVEQVPDSHRIWAVQQLGRIVRQRLPKEEATDKTWMFVNPQGEPTPLGHAVCCTGAPFGPCHWIQNQQFQAVEVRLARTRQRLTTLKTERNPENKHLPILLVSHRWNTRTLELEASETTLLSWRRVGGFDLPATVQVLFAGTPAEATTPVIGRIALSRPWLFSPPEALFASRREGKLP
jgi:Protein of unknown function (DUF3386)